MYCLFYFEIIGTCLYELQMGFHSHWSQSYLLMLSLVILAVSTLEGEQIAWTDKSADCLIDYCEFETVSICSFGFFIPFFAAFHFQNSLILLIVPFPRDGQIAHLFVQ